MVSCFGGVFQCFREYKIAIKEEEDSILLKNKLSEKNRLHLEMEPAFTMGEVIRNSIKGNS